VNAIQACSPELAKGRLRTKLPQLRQALRGRFGGHHGLLIGLALAHLEHPEGAIATLDGRIDEVIAPFARWPVFSDELWEFCALR
jgi:hypothetical protein